MGGIIGVTRCTQKRFVDHPGLDITRMGVRAYDPHLGRFLSQDPIAGGSANDYDYVSADPINNLDLAGTHCWSCHLRRAANLLKHPVLTYGALAFARATGAKCSDYKGMNVCYRVRGPLARMMPKVGLTIGGTVLFRARPSEVPVPLLAHEVSHGTQWAAMGDGFVPAYFGGAAFQGLGLGCNPIERAANHGNAYGC
ncbi:MAG: hypothetical protein RLY23_1417 [Actinomycetota bacterium]|jgi:RHS repeat-associated protein